MSDQHRSRDQRREVARELARRERERAERRRRLLRILVPIIVVVVLVGAGTGVAVAVAVASNRPAPSTSAGPANMITGGIQFTGEGGRFTVVKTAGLRKGQRPEPVATSNADRVPRIVTYIDFSCPGCKAFEAANSGYLKKLVADGRATLEVHPIAILDTHYQTSRYSSRANNVGACVADLAPDRFYDVMHEMYAEQPEESTAGLTNDRLVAVVHQAGLNDPAVDRCIQGSASGSSWRRRRRRRGRIPPSGIRGTAASTRRRS
ncbi:hypothetical protein GCM10025881_02910 [Pseudolysinimonas kribbensis]|uniref:Thioredoxin-like fold domain-containing protein n=1 Tax=Pseudolysinimonas kribbensis TaxID=433641 RepID=A0ABQ6K3M7_9MICO|nr:hypothetical protein GCM10025881_02910 [Pseudolysinimonas kribbensis]